MLSFEAARESQRRPTPLNGIVLAAGWLVLLGCGITAMAAPANVVLMLVDDVGFSDIGCYGGEARTPVLDSLASEGLRFRRFYNGARCSPTRCSILTGLYAHQVASDPAQALPNLRNDNNATLAEVLGAAGYRTYMAGKWHLGGGVLLPESRGFQHVWRFANGTAHSADNWNSTVYTLVSQNGEIAARSYGAGQFYQTDAIGDYAVDFLNHHFGKNDGKPFFMYLAFGSAHFPIQAPKALADSYLPTYTNGWDVVRTQRYNRMQAQGVIDARHPLSERGGTAAHQSEPIEVIPAWDTLPADRQADLARRMALYTAMIDKVDQNVGRVVARLQQAGALNNTLLLFLSDNGGNHEGGRFGQTETTVNAAPVTGTALDNMGQSGQPDLHLGGGWANVNNTPFRFFKHYLQEGGIRTPFIMHWPDGLTRTNAWEEQPAHLIDVAATILDATGVAYPRQFNNHVVLPFEGQSLKSLFSGQPGVSRTIGFEHESNRAWLHGDWKLVTKNFPTYDGSSPADELELYNLSTDPVELTNLASLQPTLLTQMIGEWNAWATRVGVPASRLLPEIPATVTPAASAADLFLDTFTRPNATNIDVSSTGMSGSRVPQLGLNATYYEGFEGSGTPTSIQLVNGALQMAVGAGMSENGLMHNFVGQDILDSGGFSVELTVRQINTDSSDAVNRYVGFGVGLSQAEAATGWDVGNTLPSGKVAFRGRVGGNTGVADFFVELDLNGNIKAWRNGALLETVPAGKTQGTLTARFALNGFTTANTVTVTVFFDGQLVDINTADPNSVTRTFQWDRNNSNYIGLSARASNFTEMDNLAVRKLPIAPTLATGLALRAKLSGSDTAADADPDHDGVDNFGEWAFGGNPAIPAPATARVQLITVTPASAFQFELRRLKNSAAVGLAYHVYFSENLADWQETTPLEVVTTPVPDQPDYETARLQLPAAVVSGKSKLFVRVRAEALP